MVWETDLRNKRKWLEKDLSQGKITQEHFDYHTEKIEAEIKLKAEEPGQKLLDNYHEARSRLDKICKNFIIFWPITVVIIAVNSFLDKQWIKLLIMVFLLMLIFCVSIPNIRLFGIMQKFENDAPLRNNKYMSYIGLMAMLYASISIWNHSLPYGIIGVIIGMICALINGFSQYMSIQGEKE